MALKIAGTTTHFIVRHDDAVGAPALAVANMVLGLCEGDLFRLKSTLPHISDPTFTNPPIDVQIVNDPLGGPGFSSADQSGYSPGHQSRIRINPFSAPGVPITPDYAGFLLVAEAAELIMGFFGWDGGSSQGEALSRVMAEELHPASTSNFVNSWLSWPRPRPDWILRDEPHDPPSGGFSPIGDLDPIAYGCGMIFIYFLRYQLGFSYDQIVDTGDTLLSERYAHLTGATDNPADRVNKLLDAHFGTGKINLVGNNPFPLFEGTARRVLLGWSKPTGHTILLPQTGVAHIKPFVTCPAADYPYHVYGSNITQTITATTVGIGIPVFTWHLNGKKLWSSGSTIGESVTAKVDVPDPQNPDQAKRQTETLTFDYHIVDNFTAAGGSSALTITTRSTHGTYSVDIQVEADERALPTGPVTAQQSGRYATRTVHYEGAYDADQERCEKAFENEVAKRVRVIQDSLYLLKNRPDPPPDAYLPQVVEATDRIQETLADLANTDHALANQIAHYAAMHTGVAAQVFLKSAEHTAPATTA